MSPRTGGATQRYACFAVTAPGLEGLTADELVGLDIAPGAREPGGVAFNATVDALYRANCWLRTASRVTVRLGEFGARGFPELERQARRLAWEAFLARDRPLALRVTCRKSKLYHSDAVAERIAGAISARLGAEPPLARASTEDDDTADDTQLIVVRLMHDRCTISVDSSGSLLHRRGYRLATGKAPLRETLAAAMLIGSGWDGTTPLLDPLCGSGTVVIEAAMLARRIAPGVARAFAFMHWPGFDPTRWARVVADARAGERAALPAAIQGSDRDAGAIQNARANATRAGVAADLELDIAPLSAMHPPAGPGFLVTNPPYGVRVGDRDRLRDLYAQLGHLAHDRCAGWTLAMLSAEPRLERQVGVEFETVLRTRNGGLGVRLVKGRC